MRDLLALHVEVGQYAALTALDAVGAPEARGLRPEVAGMHGQTVFHDPQGKRSGVALSIQIGEPTAVARALDCSVVSNFRMADVLEGGEGAPLVPRFDFHQFVSDVSDRVLLNLGGLSLADRLRTAVEITAGAVARGVALSGNGKPDEVLVSGGGARNRTLLRAIGAALPGSKVRTTEALGVPVSAKEAMAFAFLAF